ncbi:MAG: hypothetical protein LBT74_00810 [Acidobacteriota bacterium]|jgi:hypothetical protein|nr:hypothetical protein [Acidobacteriota bacterium]
MRFRSVLVLIVAVAITCLSGVPEAAAQKRVAGTVNPNANAYNDTAEIYNPATGTTTPTAGQLATAREGAIAARLTNGKVLVAGGSDNNYLRSAELYSPSTGLFDETGDMQSTRGGATGLTLSGGAVLLIGGYNGNYVQTMEQYDPVAETFSVASSQMTTTRQRATATLLADGTVLIAGGFNGSFLASAEIYDPSQRTVAATEDMDDARVGHGAVRLLNNKVLVVGGCTYTNSSESVCDRYLSSAEVYDATEWTFELTAGALHDARRDATVTLLPNGKVLVVGGTNATGALASAEIFDPATGTFTLTGSMGSARVHHTATMLNDGTGRVLIAGGEDASGPLQSMELYDPATGTFSPVGAMTVPRSNHAAVALTDGTILLVGGSRAAKLVFDVNEQVLGDNVGGDIWFTPDSLTGYVAYTGSGTVVTFSTATAAVTSRIYTGGNPVFITPVLGDQYLLVVSAMDNKIFKIDVATSAVTAYTFAGATFGFGSRIELSPDGATGYISSTGTGAVIKFDVAGGGELGRFTGLRAPAQVTVTPDGGAILVVDAASDTVTGVNTAGMTFKYTFAPKDRYYPANFTISNKVVLNSAGDIAFIASQDTSSVSDTYSAGFIFDPADGEWILDDEDDDTGGDDEADDGIYAVGYGPAYTTLAPVTIDGVTQDYWIVLTQNYLSLVPTIDPRNDAVVDEGVFATNYAISGQPMGSSNVVIVGNHAFFAAATTDNILQMDLATGAIIGAYLVGDNPNLGPDQPISLAMSPDGSTLAAMSFVTNEVNLLIDSYAYRQTRYISQQDRFTGLSIINTDSQPARIVVTAKTNGGIDYYTYADDEITNPVEVTIPAGAQLSIDVSTLFGLDNSLANEGYISVDSDQPVIIGFTAVGQIQSGYMGGFPNSPYTRSLEGSKFYATSDVSHDWIIPEIPEDDDATTEVSLVNPWYSASSYTVTHYGTDGTEMEVEEKSLAASAREATTATGVTSNAAKGQVVVIGGNDDSATQQNAEIFDSASLSYLSATATTAPRQGHSAAPLINGKVLVAGGRNGYDILNTAELYNPSTGAFTSAPGAMNVERYRHTATRLLNSLVLLAGGQTSLSITKTAELYDYSTGSFTFTAGEMTMPRDAHTATRLDNGKVLLIGGMDGVGVTATAEIYDPATETFTATGSMSDPRVLHTATLLSDGRVLVVGGYNGDYLDSAEIYDPATGAFTRVALMATARSNHTATLLSDGTVLVAGGRNASTEDTGGLETAEVYDPSTNLFSATGNNMSTYRSYHTAVNLQDDAEGNNDRVIVSGGFGIAVASISDEDVEVGALATSDIYTPGTRLFTTVSSNMSYARIGHTALLMDETVTSGYLRVQSDQGILGSESFTREAGGAPASVDAIDMAKYAGVTTLYSPRFVLGDDGTTAPGTTDRITLLNVINGNEDAANVTIRLHLPGGVVVCKPYALAANAQIKGALTDVCRDPAPALPASGEGWIEVVSDKDSVVGVVSFTDATLKYLGGFELSGTPATDFVFPLASEDADFETVLTFLNSGSATASATLDLCNQIFNLSVDALGNAIVADTNGNGIDEVSGAVTGGCTSTTFSLAGGANLSGTLSSLTGAAVNMTTGYVRVTSSQPLHGMGELRAKDLRFITPVPPVEQ